MRDQYNFLMGSIGLYGIFDLGGPTSCLSLILMNLNLNGFTFDVCYIAL